MTATVVITGASAGIGRATAIAFANQGANVALMARGRQGLDAATKDVQATGSEAFAVSVDVANSGAVESAAQEVEDTLGPIDIWVNNAMTTVFSPVSDIEPEEYKRVTDVTYLGTVYGTMAALRRMRPRNSGVIVQVGSALAYRSIPLQSAYCGAKSAVRGFTDALRCELIHDKSNIHLTMVQLPAVNTPQFNWCRTHLDRHPRPVPPIYEPNIAAGAIVWAATHRRREVTVGSSSAMAILGTKFFPGLGDRMLAREGYEEQMTDTPIDAERPDNLFDPVAEDYGAEGAFRNRARSQSWQLWTTTHLPVSWLVDAIASGWAASKQLPGLTKALFTPSRG